MSENFLIKASHVKRLELCKSPTEFSYLCLLQIYEVVLMPRWIWAATYHLCYTVGLQLSQLYQKILLIQSQIITEYTVLVASSIITQCV